MLIAYLRSYGYLMRAGECHLLKRRSVWIVNRRRLFVKRLEIWLMDFRSIRYGRFNSQLVRRVLGRLYRAGTVYRIWFGPLRGMRMRYDPSINFHAILGLWDTETFKLLDRVFVKGGLLSKKSTVVDVGGNIGYYTTWLCAVAAAKGQVYCFEPNPEVVRLLRDNLSLNGVTNCEVNELACGNQVGAVEFFLAKHHHSSSLHRDWARGENGDVRIIRVQMTTLDAFFTSDTKRQPPAFIKIDIEGGATYALPGCWRIIREVRPFILIESHMPDEDRAISNVLCEFNYRGYRLDDKRWVSKRDAIHPDADGVWGTLLLVPAEREARVRELIGGSYSREARPACP